MTTFEHPPPNTRQGQLSAGMPEEEQMGGISALLQFADQRQVSASGQSGFKSEISAAGGKVLNLLQHHSPGTESRGFRR